MNDARVADLLDALTPGYDDRAGDWTRVVRDARSRRRRPAPAWLVVAVAVAAAVAVLAWPFEAERGGVLERALAALGDGPVVHAVLETQTGAVYVELATGREWPQRRRVELWHDQARRIRHTIVSIEGRVSDELLQTPDGGVSSGGPIYTCRWILEHPVEARRAGVSCAPKDAPASDAPLLEPALSAFVDGYRSALRSGRARELGGGRVNGRAVTWLELDLRDGGSEQVAVDDESGRPLRVRVLRDGQSSWSYDVLAIEALGADEGNFEQPKPVGPTPASGQVRESDAIPLADAAEVLPGALWAGPRVGALELREVRRTVLTTGYGPRSGREPTRGPGVELEYGAGGRFGRANVWIGQSRAPQIAYRWLAGAHPPPGTLLLTGFGGLLVRDGVYVTIYAPTPDAIVAAARQLEPIGD